MALPEAWSLLTLWSLGWGSRSRPTFPSPDALGAASTLILVLGALAADRAASVAAARGDARASLHVLLPVLRPFLVGLAAALTLLVCAASAVLACEAVGSFPARRAVQTPLNAVRVFLLELTTHAPAALLCLPVLSTRAAAAAFARATALAALPAAVTLGLSVAFWDVGSSGSADDVANLAPRLGVAGAHGAVALVYVAALIASPDACGGFFARSRPALRPYAWAVVISRAIVVGGLIVSAVAPNSADAIAFDAALLASSVLLLPLALFAALVADAAYWRGALRVASKDEHSSSRAAMSSVRLLLNGALAAAATARFLFFSASGFNGGYGEGLRAGPTAETDSSSSSDEPDAGDGGAGAHESAASASATTPLRRIQFSRGRTYGTLSAPLPLVAAALPVVAPPVSPRLLAASLRSWTRDAAEVEAADALPALMALLDLSVQRGALAEFSSLTLRRTVDHGGQTAVFKGVYNGPQFGQAAACARVAIKVFKPSDGLGVGALERIGREVRTSLLISDARDGAEAAAAASRLYAALGTPAARGVPPPVIVRFVGVCFCPPDFSVLSEWCAGGTLRGWLDGQRALVPKRREPSSVRASTFWQSLDAADGDAPLARAPCSCEVFLGAGEAPSAKLAAAVDRRRCVIRRAANAGAPWDPRAAALASTGDSVLLASGWRTGVSARDVAMFPATAPDSWPVDDVAALDECWGCGVASADDDADDASESVRVLPRRLSAGARQRLLFARDAAASVAFLHAFAPSVAHLDVKSPNFFVAREKGGARLLRAKLGDFGDAEREREPGGARLFAEAGTAQWMAPEVGAAAGYTARADLFSLAVVLWELATGLPPFDGLGKMLLRDLIADGARPAVPRSTPRALAHLIRTGWHADETARPPAAVTARVLQRMVEHAATLDAAA
jgi:hypothetical protein